MKHLHSTRPLRLLLVVLATAATGCGGGSSRADETNPSATTVEPRTYSVDEVVGAFTAVGEQVEVLRDLNKGEEEQYVGDRTVPLAHSALYPSNVDRFDYYVYLFHDPSDAANAERKGPGKNSITGDPVSYLRVANVLVEVANSSQKRSAVERALERLASSGS